MKSPLKDNYMFTACRVQLREDISFEELGNLAILVPTECSFEASNGQACRQLILVWKWKWKCTILVYKVCVYFHSDPVGTVMAMLVLILM